MRSRYINRANYSHAEMFGWGLTALFRGRILRHMTIGEQIRAAREAAGVSQSALAGRASVTPSWVSRVEAGGDCSAATLRALAAALGLRLVLAPAGPTE